MSLLIALAFFIILAALAAAGFFMLKSSGQSDEAGEKSTQRNSRMARALTLRIGMSVVLFICVLLAWKLGYIQPSGLPMGR
jgi:ABC-type uncharacterized transport system YnjBCD permease subunit